MTGNGLWDTREWLTVEDAADYLSTRLKEPCSSADILRLAIDGHLATSLYLPGEIVARCKPRDAASDTAEKRCRVQGLCDLPMVGRARLQIEHDYQWLQSSRFVPIDGPVGAIVEQGDSLCQLPPDRGESGFSPRSQSEFPQGAVLCVRTSVLETFAQKHLAAHPAVPAKEAEKSLETRERTSLLRIIAALADAAGIDLSKPSKASEAIAKMTERLGARVSARAIENHLKAIPEALERRGD